MTSSNGLGRWAAIGARLDHLTSWVTATQGWQRYLLAFLLGAFTATAMAPYYILPALIIGYGGLVLLLDGAARSPSPKRMAFLTGWAFGFGYFLMGMYWLGFAFLVQADQFAWMIPIAVPAFTAFLGLFYALPSLLAIWRWPSGWRRIVLLAVLIAIFEFIRGNILTGLPWNLTSQAFAGTALLGQPLAWFGPYGYSLILLCLAMLPVLALRQGRPLDWRPLAGMAAGMAGILLFGTARLALYTPPAPEKDAPSVIVVQPNVAQRDKTDPVKQQESLARMIEMTARQGEQLGPALAIWPENAHPFLADDPDGPVFFAQSLPPQTSLISGTIRRWQDEEGVIRYGNSVAMFGPTEEDQVKPLKAVYDKHHLVPFGEYLPFKGLLTHLGLSQLAPVTDGFMPGPGPAVYEIDGVRFAPLICYEDVFPRRLYPSGDRPDLLVVVTNDAWFGDNAGPKQHLDISRMRVIESGLPMARSANTGVSGLFDASGQLLDWIALYQLGIVSQPIPAEGSVTVYQLFGELSFLLLVMCAAAVSTLSRLVRIP